jgi:hypothetical protein
MLQSFNQLQEALVNFGIIKLLDDFYCMHTYRFRTFETFRVECIWTCALFWIPSAFPLYDLLSLFSFNVYGK